MLEGLDPEQLLAVTTASPLLIVAPAGSGKTRVLTRRIAYQIATGEIRASETVAISFTRSAAFEMRRRLSRLTEGMPPACGTFHSVALRTLKEHARLTGRAMPRVIDSSDSYLRQAVGGAPGSQLIFQEIARARAEDLDAAAYSALPGPLNTNVSFEAARAAFSRFDQLRKRQGVMDLTDLVGAAARVLRGSDHNATRLRLGAKWVFVDEFQDLNRSQLGILEAWLGPQLTGLTAVGDPNQAIFRFNGSDPSLLTELHKRVPGLNRVRLRTNYRSTPPIVAAANLVLARQVASSSRSGGADPIFEGHASKEAEATGAVSRLRELKYLGVPFGKMAILSRTAKGLAAVIAELDRLGIPHTTPGVSILASAPATRRLMAGFKAAGASITEICDTIEAEIATDPALSERTLLSRLHGLATETRRLEPDSDWAGFFEVVQADRSSSLDLVNLATFHSAKGLQWFHVHLVQVAGGMVPHRLARAPADLAEERRLLYVAMTRATDSLSISWSPLRSRSRFLDDLAPPTPASNQGAQAKGSRPRAQHPAERWRAQTARARGVPANLLLSDGEIFAIKRTGATSDDDLRRCLRGSLTAGSERLRSELLAALNR